ncbi:hypothetical protein HMPREF1554_00910 [Porphyromonas gingivalis F0569]|nr:hypothetical protein HMPREF1554_00910 [Porphyromonas gingivalis F0569]
MFALICLKWLQQNNVSYKSTNKLQSVREIRSDLFWKFSVSSLYNLNL